MKKEVKGKLLEGVWVNANTGEVKYREESKIIEAKNYIAKLDIDGSSIEGSAITRGEERSDVDSEDGKEDSNEDGTEGFHNSTVHIGPLAPNGFYDLIVKTTKGEKSVKSEKILQQEKSINKYRWRGSAYEKIK